MPNLIIEDKKAARRTQPIHKTPFRIGRGQANDLVLESKIVSREHAEIVGEKGRLTLVDLDSLNGTLVNGKRLAPYLPEPLRHGDQIQIGKLMIAVQFR